MDLSERSHKLINRLERKLIIKLAIANSYRHKTIEHHDEFNFSRERHHLKIID